MSIETIRRVLGGVDKVAALEFILSLQLPEFRSIVQIWVIRIGVSIAGILVFAFVALCALALHPTSRAWVSKKVGSDEASSLEVPNIASPSVDDSSSAEQNTAGTNVDSALDKLTKSALMARIAMAGPDIDVGREVFMLTREGKQKEAQQLIEKYNNSIQTNDRSQVMADEVFRTLEQALVSDSRSTEEVIRAFAAKTEDRATKQMLEKIADLSNRADLRLGKANSTFAPEAMGLWSSAAYDYAK